MQRAELSTRLEKSGQKLSGTDLAAATGAGLGLPAPGVAGTGYSSDREAVVAKHLSLFSLVAVALVLFVGTSPAAAQPDSGPIAIEVSPDPEYLAIDNPAQRLYVASQYKSETTAIDASTGDVLATTHAFGALAVNESAGELYVAGQANLWVLDSESLEQLDVLDFTGFPSDLNLVPTSPHPDDPSTRFVGYHAPSVAFNPATGKVYAGGMFSGNLLVVDGESHAPVASIQTDADIRGLVADPNTNRIYLLDGAESSLRIIDGESDAEIKSLPLTGPMPWEAAGLAINPDTGLVYTIGARGFVEAIDGATTTAVGQVDPGGWPVALGLDQSHGHLYVATGRDTELADVDLDNMSVRRLLMPAGAKPTAVAANPSTGQVYVARRALPEAGHVLILSGG